MLGDDGKNLIVGMVSQMYTYVKNSQTVNFTCLEFIIARYKKNL